MLALQAQGFRHKGWANIVWVRNSHTGAPHEYNDYLLLLDTLWCRAETVSMPHCGQSMRINSLIM